MGWFKDLFKIRSKDTQRLTEKNIRWNRFIDEICSKDINVLSTIQKNAVLPFWYDAEMNSGGHSGYFDCYPETKPEELVAALIAVGTPAIANNYKEALQTGEIDDYEKADRAFYCYKPSLADVLMEYVELNKENIFR